MKQMRQGFLIHYLFFQAMSRLCTLHSRGSHRARLRCWEWLIWTFQVVPCPRSTSVDFGRSLQDETLVCGADVLSREDSLAILGPILFSIFSLAGAEVLLYSVVFFLGCEGTGSVGHLISSAYSGLLQLWIWAKRSHSGWFCLLLSPAGCAKVIA